MDVVQILKAYSSSSSDRITVDEDVVDAHLTLAGSFVVVPSPSVVEGKPISCGASGVFSKGCPARRDMQCSSSCFGSSF